MNHQRLPRLLFLFFAGWIFIISCNNSPRTSGVKKIVDDPERMDQETSESIREALTFALQNNGLIDDSTRLSFLPLVNDYYEKAEYQNVWSHKERWEPLSDSLISFIQTGELYGLFPKDYHLENLLTMKRTLEVDSLKKMDAEMWAKADMVFTEGFMHLLKDIKIGRLSPDSILFNKIDTLTPRDFYTASLKTFAGQKQLTELINAAEPKVNGYIELKKCIPLFLDSMDRKQYTYVPYPFKVNDVKDSMFFIKKFQKRLRESGYVRQDSIATDSSLLNAAIKRFQKKKGIKQDGKISASLIRLINLSDVERFKRIAITLDRYKQLPPVMPEKYILVNLPSYYMDVWDHDSVAIRSKIICGKPDTRTPLLNSVISDMVTYPTWTVPNSIIAKQYLPKLKVNPNYLSGIGLHLVNDKGETIDPNTVNWSKYKKGIPFKVMQGSGDDNALGILKFNFNNPYSVYLHDTNQRYLFKNASRALSHGCVRVEQWEELAFFIARNDSMNLKPGDSLRYNTDTIVNLLARKEKKRLVVKNGLPLFIAYFSCEGRGGKIKFYDDIYGEDKVMREKYFSEK
ncbi:MAG: L,D-transpeptidase family protein [Ferruginibacter sp.]|nr:L,D-transpeptidase family protein [Ferruginibacter sp.]